MKVNDAKMTSSERVGLDYSGYGAMLIITAFQFYDQRKYLLIMRLSSR